MMKIIYEKTKRPRIYFLRNKWVVLFYLQKKTLDCVELLKKYKEEINFYLEKQITSLFTVCNWSVCIDSVCCVRWHSTGHLKIYVSPTYLSSLYTQVYLVHLPHVAWFWCTISSDVVKCTTNEIVILVIDF